MSPAVRRRLIPVVVVAVALGLVVTLFTVGRGPTTPSGTAARPAARDAAAQAPADQEKPAATDLAPPDEPPADAPAAALELTGLQAVAPGPADPPTLAALGSLDPRAAPMEITFSRVGAGIARITLASEWISAADRHQADAHFAALAAGAADVPPLPDESRRHLLISAQTWRGVEIPVLAARFLIVGEERVDLLYRVDEERQPVMVWSETGPGAFETIVRNAQGRDVLRIVRAFTLSDVGDVTLEQRVENLSGTALDVQWVQFGPADLPPDRSQYIDRRRFRFGHLFDPSRDPSRRQVFADRTLLLERTDVPDLGEREKLWPNDTSRKKGYELSWFASTNRYFALAVHPVLRDREHDSRSLANVVAEIGYEKDTAPGEVVFSVLFSPRATLAAGASRVLDLGVYAGPQDRHILGGEEPYATLGMKALILYQMSSCCAICTFPWLAELLLRFLALVSSLVGDWGVAIIVLVCVVRALLHPLTRRGQISMQRFSKQMTDLKPEIDKLRLKYEHDPNPKKMQQEQMKLMRERGVNPVQLLGCLPMFLQMPIWIALYAMLYFAFDMRHQPAFYGLFQKISGGAWPFLGDLSDADRFIPLFDEPRVLSFFLALDYSSINLLPVLMGVLFFIQQKYMTPPPGPTATREMIQQQKIMKFMMVVMMPLFLYSAPSGLTLYILTSSAIGILESRYIRRHIKEMDLRPPAPRPAAGRKPRGAMGRAYAMAMERAETKRREKQRGPETKFKKRKR